MGLAAGILITCEIAARYLLAPVHDSAWAYWDDAAANKFEWYRHMARQGTLPDYVVIGDSIAARNFDPVAFEDTSVGSAYNMGWPGMFPLGLASIALPILEEEALPKNIILLQSPAGFLENDRVKRNEAPIVNSLQARRLRGELTPADWLYLSRVYPARHFLKDAWRNGNNSGSLQPAKNGFMPHKRPKKNTNEFIPQEEKFIDQEFSNDRTKTLDDLVTMAAHQETRIIVVFSPAVYADQTIPFATKRYMQKIAMLKRSFPNTLELCDLSGSADILRFHFKDSVHLWDDGATLLSQMIAMDCVKKLPEEASIKVT